MVLCPVSHSISSGDRYLMASKKSPIDDLPDTDDEAEPEVDTSDDRWKALEKRVATLEGIVHIVNPEHSHKIKGK